MRHDDDVTEQLLWTGRPGSARLWHRPEFSTAARHTCLGTVPCTHEPQVVAGSATRLSFAYKSPAAGLGAGSRLRIAWGWPFDWRPASADEVLARTHIDGTDAGFSVIHVPRGAFDPWQHQLDVDLAAPLAEGQVLQGCPGGEAGWLAPTFACDAVDFLVAVWRPQDPRWNLVGRTKAPDVVPGPAVRSVAVAGGDAVVGEPVAVRLRCEDVWGNTTGFPDGNPHLQEEAHVKQLNLRQESSPEVSILTLRFDTPGVHRPRFDVPGLGTIVGNAITVYAEAPLHRLFFGDLHSGQTDVGCGAGSLSQHFDHARAAGLQFASQQANDHYITPARWASIRRDTAAAHRPGELVAILGCEWSPPTVDGGDRNVFYREDDPTIRRSGRHFAEVVDDPEPDLMTAPQFHAAFTDRGVLCNLHVGGRPTNLEWHDPGIEPQFEIHSTHATSEWFVEEAIERGYRVGITAGADGVYGRPGADHPGWRQNRNVRSGLTGVYATALDQASLWEAFAARRCYGTTGERISLWVEIEGEGMGGEVETDEEQVSVLVRIAGTASLERVDVLRRTEVVASQQLAGPSPDGALRLLWMGARQMGTAADQRVIWDGELRAGAGRFSSVSSVNFHSVEDAVHIEEDGAVLRWTSATAGNRGGVVFHHGGPDDTVLSLRTAPCRFDLRCADIRSGGVQIEAGGLKQRVEVSPAPDTGATADADMTLRVPVHTGEQALWVRVIQTDGAMAWSSPVVVTRS